MGRAAGEKETDWKPKVHHYGWANGAFWTGHQYPPASTQPTHQCPHEDLCYMCLHSST